MRIYILSSQTKGGGVSDALLKISAILKESGIMVLSNVKELSTNSLTNQEIVQAEHNGQILLDKVDAFIIDGSEPNPEAGYIIAYALFRKKYILYLMPGGKSLDHALAQLAKRKESAPYFHARHLAPQVLLRHIKDFLRLLSVEAKENEAPSIKFTLRITPKIDQYLSWRANRSGLKKADFLREMIDVEIKKDGYYKKEREK